MTSDLAARVISMHDEITRAGLVAVARRNAGALFDGHPSFKRSEQSLEPVAPDS